MDTAARLKEDSTVADTSEATLKDSDGSAMIPANETDQDPVEATPLPPGTALGNYVLCDRIGHGAMGAVYRAEHTLLKKAVAIKVMAAPLLDSPDARERFVREGQTAAALKHPNVVDVTDVGVAGTMPFLVMELLEGEDLEAFLERRKELEGKRLEEWEVADLIVPIVAALASAHDQGIVHRDLKPSNIFVARGSDGELTPKVLDFGICKLAQTLDGPDLESTPFNQLIGSPAYLAPEALKGPSHVSDRCDQYSLGVVLYECVAGRKPFSGDTLFSLLSAIHTGEFVRPKESRPEVSAMMEGIILRAMNVEPESRFGNMRELGRALLEVARPRTQMLWGSVFGYSESSGGFAAVSHRVEGSLDSPRKSASTARTWTRWIARHMAWPLVLVLVGCFVTGVRAIWKLPAAKGVPIAPALLVPVPVPAETAAVAAALSAEPVTAAPSAGLVSERVLRSLPAAPGNARNGASKSTPPAGAARRASPPKAVSRHPASPSEAQPRTTFANEAPIFD